MVEYGSGAAIKVRFLLDALRDPAAYVPIDISREQLARVAAELEADYPSLAVRPICGDYTRLLPLPNLPPHSRRVAFFPGSTIGNFHPAEAAAFLTRIRRTVGTGGALVIGVDRRKDAAVLHAAYDDPQGVTAAFNRNVLRRINRELGADFDLASFRHVAFFNDDASRIEMHLESTRDQSVQRGGQHVRLRARRNDLDGVVVQVRRGSVGDRRERGRVPRRPSLDGRERFLLGRRTDGRLVSDSDGGRRRTAPGSTSERRPICRSVRSPA